MLLVPLTATTITVAAEESGGDNNSSSCTSSLSPTRDRGRGASRGRGDPLTDKPTVNGASTCPLTELLAKRRSLSASRRKSAGLADTDVDSDDDAVGGVSGGSGSTPHSSGEHSGSAGKAKAITKRTSFIVIAQRQGEVSKLRGTSCTVKITTVVVQIVTRSLPEAQASMLCALL
jgi:hypothetical protein